MGDIKVYNDAGADDSPNTVTSVNSDVGRVSDLFMTKAEMAELRNQVDQNSQTVNEVVDDAPVSLNSFKEIADELDVEAFLDALEGSE